MTLTTAGGSLLGKIAGYVEILARDPRSTVFVPLAESYRQMGMLDEALEVASEGVRLLPSFGPGYTALGRIQVQRGDLGAAAGAFDRALLIDPENLVSLKGLARIRMQQGERAQALKLVRRAVALQPGDAGAQKMLAALAAPAATPSQPVATDQPATDPISTPTIAEIYIRQGFLNRAMKVYGDLLRVEPHNEEIRRKLIELKQRIEAEKTAPAPAAPIAPAAPPPAPPAEVGPAVEAAPATAGGAAQPLAVLTNWLEAIGRRRTDVR